MGSIRPAKWGPTYLDCIQAIISPTTVNDTTVNGIGNADTENNARGENGTADEIGKRDMVQRVARISFALTRIRAG